MILALLVAAAAFAAAPPSRPARPVRLEAPVADSIRKAILRDREETEAWLRGGATSYLATIQRRDFADRATLTVGRAVDNDVRLDADSVADHHLRVTVVGDSFRVEAVDPGATFRVRDEERRQAMLGPSSIAIGRFGVRLSHQRFPALIVFDPKSPRFHDYKGLRWFPPDLAWRYELGLTPNPRPDTTVILSTRGNRRRAVRVGWFDFVAAGKKCRLEATRLLEPGVGENDLSVFFRDATTGKESYEVGRYVDPERLPDGRYRIDFNLAYNPACAFSEHYNCPIPPKNNRLPIAVRAGEMDAHYYAH